jgi:hypothetical protein
MDISYIIFIYLIILITVTLVFYHLNKNLIKSLIVGLIISQISLLIIRSPNNVDTRYSFIDSYKAFYYLIMLLTPLIVYIFALYMAMSVY